VGIKYILTLLDKYRVRVRKSFITYIYLIGKT
jgi:hypothetical protein